MQMLDLMAAVHPFKRPLVAAPDGEDVEEEVISAMIALYGSKRPSRKVPEFEWAAEEEVKSRRARFADAKVQQLTAQRRTCAALLLPTLMQRCTPRFLIGAYRRAKCD